MLKGFMRTATCTLESRWSTRVDTVSLTLCQRRKLCRLPFFAGTRPSLHSPCQRMVPRSRFLNPGHMPVQVAPLQWSFVLISVPGVRGLLERVRTAAPEDWSRENEVIEPGPHSVFARSGAQPPGQLHARTSAGVAFLPCRGLIAPGVPESTTHFLEVWCVGGSSWLNATKGPMRGWNVRSARVHHWSTLNRKAGCWKMGAGARSRLLLAGASFAAVRPSLALSPHSGLKRPWAGGDQQQGRNRSFAFSHVNTTPQMTYFFGAKRVQNNYR